MSNPTGLPYTPAVAVGDWVCARLPEGHEMGLIEEILPRESDIARWRGKARGEKQTLAANVDVVLVVQQLGEREVSCERIARSAVIARDCGADVAVVLTKADRASGWKGRAMMDRLTRSARSSSSTKTFAGSF